MSSNSNTGNNSHSPYIPNQRFFPAEGEFLQRELNNSYTDISNAVNARDIAIYSQSTTSTGQRFDFIPDDQSQESMRKVILFGAIPAGNTQVLPHGLTGFTTFTRIYGVAQTATLWRPLPYASSVAANNVELFVDFTNITIINGAAAPAIVSAIVVVEFI